MGLYSSYIFPRLLDWTLGTPYIEKQRRTTLSPVHGRVLEIGFGTGLNLPYYPGAVTSLTVVEPEKMLPDRVSRRIAEARMPVDQVRLDASSGLPFADNNFDSIVTTFTLCSIADVGAALSEMRRVLKSEGQFVFLEHGRSDDQRVARRQDFFNPIQRIIGCGCNMNRSMDRLITDAGFELVTIERFLMPKTPRVFAEMYRGVATKG